MNEYLSLHKIYDNKLLLEYVTAFFVQISYQIVNKSNCNSELTFNHIYDGDSLQAMFQRW